MEEASFYGRSWPGNFTKRPQIFGKPNIRQHGTTYKSNQISQGDHKWEVTFYQVYCAPRHLEQSLSEAKFVIPLHMLVLFAVANPLVNLCLALFNIHVVFTLSMFSTVRLQFCGCHQYCARQLQILVDDYETE